MANAYSAAERALRAWIDTIEQRYDISGMYARAAVNPRDAWEASTLDLSTVDLRRRSQSGRRLTALGQHPHLTLPAAEHILQRLAPRGMAHAVAENGAALTAVSDFFGGVLAEAPGPRVRGVRGPNLVSTLQRWTAEAEQAPARPQGRAFATADQPTPTAPWWTSSILVQALVGSRAPLMPLLRHWPLIQRLSTRAGLHGGVVWAIFLRLRAYCPQLAPQEGAVLERMARLGGVHPRLLRRALLSPTRETRATGIRLLSLPVDEAYWAADPTAELSLTNHGEPPAPGERRPTLIVGNGDEILTPPPMPPWWSAPPPSGERRAQAASRQTQRHGASRTGRRI